jgi:hypothetical protein
VREPVEIVGYWQSHRYFAPAEARVREAFRFRVPLPTAPALQSDESVAVHVRRGDYLAPKRAARFGVLAPEYYTDAMALVAARVREPSFLVFSDDAAWCRDRFGGDDRVTIVAPDGRDPRRDLQLMAACRHHVVANSSFSWWAAWLGESADQVVVAPAGWHRDPSLRPDDLIRPGWLQLEPRWSA